MPLTGQLIHLYAQAICGARRHKTAWRCKVQCENKMTSNIFAHPDCGVWRIRPLAIFPLNRARRRHATEHLLGILHIPRSSISTRPMWQMDCSPMRWALMPCTGRMSTASRCTWRRLI
eukprot:scaffold179372_cov31-Tisochrysis_lutea.AAC.4